ncbi:MAG: DUF3829 domain-containing protein [Deltaproteobacteria bacterium]|nr:DUF3829 domain-containing protein [Deltaproteobacteria bacterium]MDQ3300509.1 YiiG family protein [Myxococcota bacterium]
MVAGWTTRIAALLVLAGLVLGCRGKKRPPPTPAEVETQGILAKLYAYVACLDEAPRVFKLGDVYLERFGTRPPTVADAMPVFPSGDPEKCVDAVADAKTVKPALPELEQAADAYAQTLTVLFDLTTVAHDHFDRTSKHFDPAKGIALHGRLTAVFRQFDTVQAPLFDGVYALNQKIRREQLAKREAKEGRTFPVIVEDLMMRAAELVPLAATPLERIDQIDHAAITARAGVLESVLDEMTAFAVANAVEVNEMLRSHPLLAARTQSYLVAARQLANRVSDHVPLSESDKLMIESKNEAEVVGTPAAMISAYNELVAVYSPPGSR